MKSWVVHYEDQARGDEYSVTYQSERKGIGDQYVLVGTYGGAA